MWRKLLLVGAVVVAGLHYSLMPVGPRGRNTWLPGKWAEWIDMHDWWLNFWAFVVVAGSVVWVLGRSRPVWYQMLLATSAGILLAVAIETAQLGIPGRNSDPGDLTAALAGSFAGGFLAFFHRRRPEREGPRRVAFLDQTGQLGGAELMLLDLASALRDRAEVILFADGPFREALQARGVPCQVEPLGRLASGLTKDARLAGLVRAVPDGFRFAWRLARRLREVDVVYSNTAKALVLGVVASRWAGRPLIHHLHDIIDAGHFSVLNRFLLVRAANRAQRVIANSRATAEAFVRGGGHARLVEVIPNGFDLERHLRAEGVVESGRCVFGLFGRITPWKGQDVFLEALAKLPRDQARGMIVGAALFTEEDRQFEARLRERAARPDLAGRVTFTGFRDDVLALMQREVDVVVHASVRAEPFGRVIVEGMLSGRPVIAARAGGVLGIVEDGVTGRLADPGDVASLAEAMRWMVEHPAEREALARRGEASARERYGLDVVSQRTWQVVRETAGWGEASA